MMKQEKNKLLSFKDSNPCSAFSPLNHYAYHLSPALTFCLLVGIGPCSTSVGGAAVCDVWLAPPTLGRYLIQNTLTATLKVCFPSHCTLDASQWMLLTFNVLSLLPYWNFLTLIVHAQNFHLLISINQRLSRDRYLLLSGHMCISVWHLFSQHLQITQDYLRSEQKLFNPGKHLNIISKHNLARLEIGYRLSKCFR